MHTISFNHVALFPDQAGGYTGMYWTAKMAPNCKGGQWLHQLS
jgi:hypothetical protein